MINANGRLPSDIPDPNTVALRMRINADIIMDEISAHVDKELDRFSDGLEYMKKQARKIIEERDDRV